MNLNHGGNVYEISRKYNISKNDILDFSSNINPLGISKEVRYSMIKSIDNIDKYPDVTYYDLKKAISKYEDIKHNQILVGNGATEIIFNIVRALLPKNVLLPAPTFSEYEHSAKSIFSNIIYHKTDESFNLDEGFIKKINKNINMVFICNPNNPTGVLINKDYILEIIKRSKESNCVVVIDESFMDFIENKESYSSINFTNIYDNIIVVKSLTKFFAFPGVRIGYAITNNSQYINMINNVSVTWSVNTIAMNSAICSIQQKDYIKKSIEYINIEREFLKKELSKFKDVFLYNSYANFIFFKLNKNIDLRQILINKKVLIRDCSDFIGLKVGYYRVAVKTREENNKLIEYIRNILK